MMNIYEDLAVLCKDLINNTDIRHIRMNYSGTDGQSDFYEDMRFLRDIEGTTRSTISLDDKQKTGLRKIFQNMMDQAFTGWNWDEGTYGMINLDVENQRFDVWETKTVTKKQHTRYTVQTNETGIMYVDAKEFK